MAFGTTLTGEDSGQGHDAAHAAKNAANAAIDANLIARENGENTLRPYLTPGGPDIPPIELRKDPHTHQPVIVMRFYNAGQTPALHFAAIERSDMRVAEPIHFRSRYEEIGKEGSLKGIVAIAGAGGGLSRYDQTIAAKSFAIVKLEKQGAEVTAFLQRLKHYKSKPNSDPPMDLIWGFFEYCDAFGVTLVSCLPSFPADRAFSPYHFSGLLGP